MTEGITFKAPNGNYIQGSDETIPGICSVAWYNPDDPDEAEPDGSGTDVNWDAQHGVSFAGIGVYIDEEGESWLATHLIPDAAQPYPETILTLMRTELTLARVFHLADAAQANLKGLVETIHVADQLRAAQAFRDECEFALKRATEEVRAAVQHYEIHDCWMIVTEIGIPGPDGGIEPMTLNVPAATREEADERATALIHWRYGQAAKVWTKRFHQPA